MTDIEPNDGEAPRRFIGMGIGAALQLIVNGVKVSRISWRGSYRYIEVIDVFGQKRLQSTIDLDNQTEPRVVKWIDPFWGCGIDQEDRDDASFRDRLVMTLCFGGSWRPQRDDINATDWEIYLPEHHSDKAAVAEGREVYKRQNAEAAVRRQGERDAIVAWENRLAKKVPVDTAPEPKSHPLAVALLLISIGIAFGILARIAWEMMK